MIPVGLNTIGSVVFHQPWKRIPNKKKAVQISKGDDVGYFQYGGSLNILIFEPGCFSSLSLLQGQRIGLLSKPSKK